MDQADQSRFDLVTSFDRAGLALAAGSIAGGAGAIGLALMGGAQGPISLILAFFVGAFFCALAITAVAAPIWLMLHAVGKRGPSYAAMLGAGCGFTLFLFAQTYGFGLYPAPPSDLQTLLFRWLSGAATSLILAILAGLIGLLMWRIAYRRVR